MIELDDILRRHWPSYEQLHSAGLLPSHRAAACAIMACRTAKLGGHLFECAQCDQRHYAYHSCNHRACPRCGHGQTSQWIERQKIKLLPVPYAMVTFTVPEELRAAIRSHQKLLYPALFRESSGALKDAASRPKHLGGQLGFLGVLHTWTRQLIFHPHIHYIVPMGGLSHDGLRWMRPKYTQFFLPERVLAARFRNRLRRWFQKEHPALFRTIPAAAWKKNWVVDIIAVGSGVSAVKYLARYVYKTALGSGRILSDDHRGVRFTYRDSAGGQTRVATVTAHEFIRRFMQHILPEGFQRVRYFGWMAPAAKKTRQRIHALLDWKVPEMPEPPEPPPVLCPRCHKAMELVEHFQPP